MRSDDDPTGISSATAVDTAAAAGGRRALLLVGLFVVVSIVAIDSAARHFDALTVHHLLWIWLGGHALDDSWAPMIQAYDWLQAPHPSTLYQDIFFSQHVKFQYPPTALLPLALLETLGIRPSAEVLNRISWVWIVVTALAMMAYSVLLAERSGVVARDDRRARALVAIIAAVAVMTFYPVIEAYWIGQVQVWLSAIFILACLCWLLERRLAAGILIGLVCLLKPQFALFLVWGALRRQWPFLIGWGLVVVPGLALSLALFGLANHLDYLSALQFLARHGEVFYPNQSVNGLLNRLLLNGDSLTWSGTTFPPYRPVIYFGTLLSSAILILAALFLRARQRDRAGLLDFLTAALSFTIASPIAWEHHYGILPPIFVSLLFALLAERTNRRRWDLWTVLAMAYVLSANFFPIANLTALSSLNFLQSYLLFAGLATLWLLYRVPTPPAFDRLVDATGRGPVSATVRA